MNNYAPVLIPTLNRHVHFKRCVESLSSCNHANKTDLFIAFDYPLKETHWEGYKETEQYLTEIRGFKSVTVIKRQVNYGVRKNMIEARRIIFEKYDRLIISEDDNVFGPSFLEFLNKGLITYEYRPDIFSISGYNSPFPMPTWYLNNAYLKTGFTAWGVGIWRDKWYAVDWSISNFNTMLNKKENYIKLKRNYRRYLPQLLKISNTGVITGDGFLFLYLLDKNMYSIYPVKSRVRNTGHDGSGINCVYNDRYLNQEIYTGLDDSYFPPDLQPDKKLTNYINRQIQLPFLEKVKGLIPSSLRKTLRKIVKE